MSPKNNPSKYHHVVPRVYQLQWSFNNSESIYAFYRRENFLRGEIRNAGNFLGINDINSIKLESYKFLSEEGMDELFGCLGGKIINGVSVYSRPSLVLKKLNVTPTDFITKINEYSICDENGNFLNNREKRVLAQQIKTKKFTEIESYFSIVDNSWTDILLDINKIAQTSGVAKSEEWKNKLVKYLLCQFIRNPKTSPEIEERINEILDLAPIRDILRFIPDGIEKVKSYFRKSKSIEISERQPIFEVLPSSINKYSEIFECMTYTFLNAPTECSFITSDSPICFFTKAQDLSKGVYFPINPRIMLYMVRLNGLKNYNEYFYVENISLTTTKYINDIILSNSKQNVIANQGNLDVLINGQYLRTEWEKIADKDRYFN